MKTLRAITLHQPYATLMAIGAKRIETRAWPCRFRGPLAIHAAKTWDDWLAKWLAGFVQAIPEVQPSREFILRALGAAGYRTLAELPTASVLCVVNVTACEKTETLLQADGGSVNSALPEFHFGDYTPGRYGWVTEMAHRFPEPIPARGQQNIWTWTPPAGVLEGVQW